MGRPPPRNPNPYSPQEALLPVFLQGWLRAWGPRRAASICTYTHRAHGAGLPGWEELLDRVAAKVDTCKGGSQEKQVIPGWMQVLEKGPKLTRGCPEVSADQSWRLGQVWGKQGVETGQEAQSGWAAHRARGPRAAPWLMGELSGEMEASLACTSQVGWGW